MTYNKLRNIELNMCIQKLMILKGENLQYFRYIFNILHQDDRLFEDLRCFDLKE